MNVRKLVSILILIMAVLIIFGNCTTTKKAISEEDFFKTWSGTWVNTDYGGGIIQKIINHPDGTREYFGMLTSTTAGGKDKITIIDLGFDTSQN